MSSMSSEAIEQELREKVLENANKLKNMGNLRHSLRRNLQLVKNSRIGQGADECSLFEEQINEYHSEMVRQLKDLNMSDAEIDDFCRNQDLLDDEDDDDEDNASTVSDVATAFRQMHRDPKILKEIERVVDLEAQVEESMKTLKKEKAERQSVQKDLCAMIEAEDDSSCNQSRIFKRLCDAEMTNTLNNIKNNLHQDKGQNVQVENPREGVTSTNKDFKFIKRNIKLAKNTPMMGTYCLTDEEKVKLDSLLADLDDSECNDEEFKVNGNNKEVNSRKESVNKDDAAPPLSSSEDDEELGFSFSNKQMSKLCELDEKLKCFVRDPTENLEDGNSDDEEPNQVDCCFSDVEQWKNKRRLKKIEEQLMILEREREAAQNLLQNLQKVNDEDDCCKDFHIKQKNKEQGRSGESSGDESEEDEENCDLENDSDSGEDFQNFDQTFSCIENAILGDVFRKQVDSILKHPDQQNPEVSPKEEND